MQQTLAAKRRPVAGRTPNDRKALEARLRILEWIAATQAMLAEFHFDLDGFMAATVERVLDATHAKGVIVELVEGEDMVYRAVSEGLETHLGLRLRRAGSLSGLRVERRDTLLCRDSELDPRVDRDACRRIGLRSMVCVPLVTHGEAVGALKAFSAAPDAFSTTDVDLLSQLATALAAALAKQLAFDRLETEILARRAAEDGIRQSEARYRLLAENSTDVIACFGSDARFTYLSPSIHAVLGYEPHELIGRSTEEIMHPDDYVWSLQEYRRHLASPQAAEPFLFKYRAFRKDGAMVWLAGHPRAIFEPISGAVIGFQDVVRDVTVQVAQEAALAEARAAAEAAAVAKADFLANMSHEIRTPLTAVLGFASLLRERGNLEPEAALYAQRIDTAGRALMGVINDILDFSKLEAGEVELKPRATDVAGLARDVLSLFQVQAEQKGLSLSFDAAEATPSLLVVDPQAVRQVLFNLIGNAVKFTERGAVRVRLAHLGGRLTVSVSDDGPGLTSEEQDRLFRRFSQVDGSSARRHGGTGLGLAICKALVEAMGGAIGVTSSPGEGATFQFEVAAAAAATQAAHQDEALSGPSLEGIRILVVDDMADNRDLARAMLESLGAEVEEAADGQAALDISQYIPFDVILMDRRMPGLDGVAAARAIKAEPGPNQDIPILAFSVDGDEGVAPEAFDGVLRKPFSLAALRAAIAEVISDQLEISPAKDRAAHA